MIIYEPFIIFTGSLGLINNLKPSISFGKSVVEYKKDSKAASEIEALANEVIYLLDI